MGYKKLKQVGLGLRTDFIDDLMKRNDTPVDFLEVAPENWINVQGKRADWLKHFRKHYPIIAHGLSLSIAGPTPLNEEFIEVIDEFLKSHKIDCYSEHFSYCSDEQGYFYDLLPIPFTKDCAKYVSKRVKKVQKKLNMQIALENSSYYYAPGQIISEVDFVKSVLEQADCLMLLDINNVYVNSVNHGYDPYEYISNIPTERIAYFHIAGHDQREENLIIDTHGAPVIDPVWDLLRHAYTCHGRQPTLLERDANIPPLETLLEETKHISDLQNEVLKK